MTTKPPPAYKRVPHPHTPRNVNTVHQAERATGSPWKRWNERIAVGLTLRVGTMETAYIFCLLAFVGLLGLLGGLSPFTFLLASWASQQFTQLVLLPVIMLGQNVLSRKAELQAEETYQTTLHILHDVDQLHRHQDAQDQLLRRILAALTAKGASA